MCNSTYEEWWGALFPFGLLRYNGIDKSGRAVSVPYIVKTRDEVRPVAERVKRAHYNSVSYRIVRVRLEVIEE